MNQKNNNMHSKNHVVKMIIAWLIALVPLTWGLYNTMIKAMPLFQ